MNESLTLEAAIVGHLARYAPTLRVEPDGAPRSAPDDVPGTPVLDERLARGLGALTARFTVALQGFFHPDAGRPIADALTVPGPAGENLAALPGGVQHGGLRLGRLLFDDAANPTGARGLERAGHRAAATELAGVLAHLFAEVVDGQPVPSGASRPDALGTKGFALLDAAMHGYQQHRRLSLAEVDALPELIEAALLADGAEPAHALWRRASGNAQHLAARMRRLAGLAAPGLPGAAVPDPAALLARRRTVLGGSISPLFYAEPLEIVAGEGVWLFDQNGRGYLDGYNNVAVVGHSHPRVVAAISSQAARLHTHSRYLHPNVVELAERLIASMPAGSGLDTCFFTTSGTEANELAWRLAIEHTGGNSAIIGSFAYHGASRQMADLSSNEWPPGYRPERVAAFDGPVQYPDTLTENEGRRRVAAAVGELCASSRPGTADRPAMVIADTMFTSEGARPQTGPFLTGLLEGAHDAGALFVADEVQIGFGRTGPLLWRFAGLGLRPDVVTMGKPMGAGYPTAAVITRRDIAESLGARYEYFSTFAANPVGTAAALAVLDVLADEGLPQAALVNGELLRRGVESLRPKHSHLGEVRGAGLIAGVDLPDRATAVAVREGLKARGVLVGTTGRDGNTLKVRPPLAWTAEHVELFLDRLDATLAHTP